MAEVERLRAALADAIDCVQKWAEWGDCNDHTHEEMQADLARLRAALNEEGD